MPGLNVRRVVQHFQFILLKGLLNNESGIVIYFESERLDEWVNSLKGNGFQFL